MMKKICAWLDIDFEKWFKDVFAPQLTGLFEPGGRFLPDREKKIEVGDIK